MNVHGDLSQFKILIDEEIAAELFCFYFFPDACFRFIIEKAEMKIVVSLGRPLKRFALSTTAIVMSSFP